MTKSASNEFRELLSAMQTRTMYDLNVASQCIVKNYDKGKNVCDVTTAIKDKDGTDDTVTIIGCPVLTSALIIFDKVTNEPKYKELKKDEKVMVVFDNRSMDNFTDAKGKTYEKNSETMHSMNDGIVIGRYEVIDDD